MRPTARSAAASGAVVLALLLAVPGTGPAPARADTPAPEIVGGVEVDPPGKYPFMVALVTAGADAYRGQFCGGSLIAPDWVLTAAHCVQGETAAGIDVVIGRHDLTAPGGERIRVRRIVVHPDYRPATSANDVAVLELVSRSSYASVSLPADGSLETAGREATVAGWGDTLSRPRFPTALREVAVPLVSDAACASAYGTEFKAASMICAGDLVNGGVDSCQGDSGGPLFVAAGRGWTQVGVVSWGYVCADAAHPGVYARVSALQGWITSVTGVRPGTTGWAPRCAGETATLWGTPGPDTLVGTAGRDVIVGFGGDDVIIGWGGDDVLCGGSGDDVLRGGGGDDLLIGHGGADVMYGASGNDRIWAGIGADAAWGGAGADVLIGGGGADDLYGGTGNDVLRGGPGTDAGDGGAGIDRCVTEAAVDCE